MDIKKVDGLFALFLAGVVALAGCGGSGPRSSSGSGSGSNSSTPTLSSVAVSASAPSVHAGSTLQLSAKGTYSDGSKSDLTAQVTWKSSDTAIASIDSKGVLTAAKAGSVTATATQGSVSGTLGITVDPVAVTLTGINVTASSTTAVQGSTQQLTAQGTYSDSSTQTITSQVVWQSSESTIASVSNTGVLSANNPGSATITATMGSVSGTLAFVVSVAAVPAVPEVASIFVSPSQFSVASGQAKQLTAQAVYSDGTRQDVTSQVAWSSSNDSILAVASTGLATGVSTGTATITATLGSAAGTAVGTVTNVSLSSILVTPASASVAIGQTQAFTANGVFSDGSSTDITSSVTWGSAAPNIASVDEEVWHRPR